MHRALHLAVGRPGSDVRRRRLLTVAVVTPLAVGWMLGRFAPFQGGEGGMIVFVSSLAVLAAAGAAVRATEVGQ